MKNQITYLILFKIWPTNRSQIVVKSKAKSYSFHFHKNYVTWPLSANGLFRENCSCNIHSDCIGFSRQVALAAYWGRGVDLVLFLGESAKTKLFLKSYVRDIIYNLYKVTDCSFSWIAFNSVASLSLTVCADRNVFRETCRFEWRFLPNQLQLLYCREGSQVTLHWIKERET